MRAIACAYSSWATFYIANWFYGETFVGGLSKVTLQVVVIKFELVIHENCSNLRPSTYK